MPRRQIPPPIRKRKPPLSPKRRRAITPYRKKIPEAIVYNRLLGVMEHIQDYYFEGASHLAKDAGISRAALSRLINGRSSPSYALVCALTKAIEKKVGHHIDPRDLISLDRDYLTPSLCEVTLCDGCLPDCIYDDNGDLKAEYRHLRSGQWSRENSALGDRLTSTNDNEP